MAEIVEFYRIHCYFNCTKQERVYSMKIRSKLFISFAALIILLLGLSLFTYDHIKKTGDAYQEMMGDLDLSADFTQIQYRLTGLSNDERAYLITKDGQYPTEIAQKRAIVADLFAAIEAHPSLNDADKSRLAEIKQLYDAYAKASDKALAAMKSGNTADAQAIHFGDERTVRKQVETLVSDMIASFSSELDGDQADRKAEQDNELLLMILICTVSVIVAIVIGLLLSRSITRPLAAADRQMKEIADGHGDLSRELKADAKDEIADLARTFNRMIANLRGILSQAQDTVFQVASSAEQLTASAEQTTRVTEQIVESTQTILLSVEDQQRHVSGTVQSMHDMAGGIRDMSGASEEISTLAHSASEATRQGAAAVRDIVEDMQHIQTSVESAAAVIQTLGDRSQQIGGITGMIADLANRTNLLSLNAAIEAARAGEHGKGFAVVAQEIRKLAEQSERSSQQIAELIAEIVEGMGHAVHAMDEGKHKTAIGLHKAETADRAFSELAAHVDSVSDQIERTSATTIELAASSQHIVELTEAADASTNQVAAACQNNSAATEEQLAAMEEISSSAHALSALAEDLHGVLSKFKLR